MKSPLYPGNATLVVRNLDLVAQYYETVLGFDRVAAQPGSITLGAAGDGFLTLLHRPDAAIASPTAAGLFHIAYLVPSREALGAWLTNAVGRGAKLDGASDHLVSEALYLSDPEGNGIEVYSDRAREAWKWSGDGVEMATVKLNLPDLMAAGTSLASSQKGLPPGTRIGHVHLKVGDIAAAEKFYCDGLGLDITRRRGDGATFYSYGGYHHHLATNIWRSPGAGKRPPNATGLHSYEIFAKDGQAFADIGERLRKAGGSTVGSAIEAADPWGTVVRLVQA